MDLGERERPRRADQDAERGEAQLPTAQGVGGVRRTPDRLGASDPGTAEAAPAATQERGPDRIAEAGELGADGGHALRETLVLRVDVFGFGDERGASGDHLVAARRTARARGTGLHDGFLHVGC
jgi:hypothetical protein